MFKVPWSPSFVLGLPPRGGENSPSDHEIQSIWRLIGIHVDFTSILHSHICSVGPSSIVWIDLGPAPPFLSMRVLEVSWSRALNLVCEVAWNVCTFGWLRPASNDLQTKRLYNHASFIYTFYFLTGTEALNLFLLHCSNL